MTNQTRRYCASSAVNIVIECGRNENVELCGFIQIASKHLVVNIKGGKNHDSIN
ncbi:MAG: hypothetical protein O4804_05665 [Trichodesmium sp. St11_bin5]|nr:hypothetical protein [Trichodesmium sp. St11_bin5]MDT9341737.1 hypothetical protein [Trichodesmium erythraeum 21-75]